MEFFKNYVKENNISLKTEEFKRKYSCGMCQELLCKPKIGRCGCRYCSGCIQTIEDNNTCPLCKKHLDHDEIIVDDVAMELKINDLIITCPHAFCEQRVKIIDMEKHLKGCDKKGIACIFSKYGCGAYTNSTEGLHSHITSDLTAHLNLLINGLNESGNEKYEKITKIELEAVQIKEEFREKVQLIDLEAGNIKEEVQRIDKSHNDSVQKMELLEANLNRKIEELDEKISNQIPQEKLKLEQEMKKKMEIIEVGENYLATEDQCRVTFNNMKDKRNGNDYDSETFCIKSYTFKIRMTYYTNYLISFRIFTVKGVNDDHLKWPLANSLNLSLIRCDGCVYNNHKFGLATALNSWKEYYNKPTDALYYLLDSHIAVDSSYVIKDDSVSVILEMLD